MLAFAPLSLLLGISACSTNAPTACRHVALSIAVGFKGQPTVRQAISHFIATGSAGLALPAGKWTMASTDQFVSGAARISVAQTPAGGYVVTDASTC